jgi:broad specificity phosphatase PhoE
VDTTILLIRHAAHGHLGTILSGRVPGLSLSAQGTAQARRLASRLAHTKIERLQTSPLERARQTAAALADGRSGVAVEESGGIVAMVSHCDIIRAVVAQVLGLSLDAVLRYDVDPASITRLQVGACGARLVSLNEGAHEQQPAS